MKLNRTSITCNYVYGQSIIGYDSFFWNHCTSNDKDHIAMLSKNDRLHILPFSCNRKHCYECSPFDFFHSRYYCPICIADGDIGALLCDPEIANYYCDKRYKLEEISEQSSIDFEFRCPICLATFRRKMRDMIRSNKKCPHCNNEHDLNKVELHSEAIGFTFIEMR